MNGENDSAFRIYDPFNNIYALNIDNDAREILFNEIGGFKFGIGYAGIADADGLSSDFSVKGSEAHSIVSTNFGAGISVPYTVGTTEWTILGDTSASSADDSLILPDATLFPGRVINVKNVSAAGFYINVTSAGGTIDGVSTWTIKNLDSYTFQSDGANWWIIGSMQ
jgi:hypothetical protein